MNKNGPHRFMPGSNMDRLRKRNAPNVPIIGAKMQPIAITIQCDEQGQLKLNSDRTVSQVELGAILSQVVASGLQQLRDAEKKFLSGRPKDDGEKTEGS